jgi:dipeptidyl aminopeptidase/acylaminoacyl peptidase
MPWIDAQRMAETQALKFRTRDGVDLDGYLTLPRDRAARRLPLVALIQAGPGQREYWEYDSTIQFLVDRGYAVLQVNVRGAGGYGAAFAQAGRLNPDLTPIADVADGIRWVIDRGIADPARVAVVGTSRFGGYAALMLAATEPALVSAVVAEEPYVDWTEGERLQKLDPNYAALYRAFIADDIPPDEATLQRLSPFHQVDRIKAPVLLIHDKRWGGYAFGRTKDLAAALAKRGGPVEFVDRLGGNRDDSETARRRYEAIAALLARHLNAPP